MTNDLGEFRLYSLMPGTYVVSATPADTMMMMPGPAAPASLSAPDDGHGITYFPGTINVDEAQTISVGLADVANASFALVPQRMTRISGIVRNSQGKPFAANLSLRTQSGGGMSMRRPGDVRARTDGSAPRTCRRASTPSKSLLAPGEDESASVPITAGGQDITDLIITTTPGATISGQVTFEGAGSADTTLRVSASSPDPGGPDPCGFTTTRRAWSTTREGFRFEGCTGRAMFNVFPVAPMSGAPRWFVKSVTFNGENITDVPLDVSAVTDGSTLEIVMTDKQTTLSGTVRDGRGLPVVDYTVAIFPDQLREGAMPGRYTRVVRPDQQGRFETRGLPPGNYLAAAVESLEQGSHWDPAFRKQIEPAATRFRLTEGQTVRRLRSR